MLNILRFTRLALALITLAAIGQQLVLHIAASYNVLNFFSYFTNLSNIFAALVLLLSVFSSTCKSRDFLRYISSINMAIVGIVFAVLLRNVDLGALLPWVNFVLHYLMPVAIVVDWLVDPPKLKLNAKHALWALMLPVAYLIYVLIRGAQTGWYPYPFLNPANTGGYSAVAAYSLGITLLFVLASWTFRSIGNSRAESSKSHE